MKKSILKLLSALTAVLLFTTSGLIALGQAEAIYRCEGYGKGNDAECIIVWSPSGDKMHYGVCHQHVRVKEDPYSFYPPVAYEGCTLDSEDKCIICHRDWSEMQLDPYSLEMMLFTLYSVTKPVDIGVSGATASVQFSDEFWTAADENGFSFGESLMVPTNYTLKLIGGAEFPYTGEAVTPAVLEVSEYGPGSVLTEYGGLKISEIAYTNNVNPGTATAAVTFSMGDKLNKVLEVEFTIIGESGSSGHFIPQQLYSGSVAIAGSLSEGAKLIVSPIADGNDGYEMLTEHAAAAGLEKLAAYDVRIQGGYDGKLKLDFAVGEKYNGKKLTVLHGKADGTVEIMYSTVVNGLAHVEVDELSPFLILAEKSENDQLGGGGSGTTTNPPTSVPTNPPTSAPTATPVPVKVPATGDSSQPLLWLAMMTAALIGLSVCVKGKRLNKQ